MGNLKIFTDNIEEKALGQIELLMSQEAFSDCKIRIMPDVHAGKGCVIGFTADLGDKVIPNIVGVDIGCGMLCVELGNIDLDLERLDDVIKRCVPSGMNVHEKQKYKFLELEQLYCFDELKNKNNWLEKSLGTLGGGNHFIEIDIDKNNNKYLAIHSGSRNLGKQVADHYQDLANDIVNYRKEEYILKKKELINTYIDQGREKEIQHALEELEKEYKENQNKIPKELSYLDGKNRDDYLHDMKICQEFAKDNRLCIAKQILCNYFTVPDFNSLRLRMLPTNCNTCYTQDIVKYDFWYFETIHNYIDDDLIVRKGAISAREREKVLIPINMRDGCLLAVGKGNEDWNYSAPHGAGRIMSRAKARETISIDEYIESMKKIYTSSVNKSTIDEAPMVYKPIEEIMNKIKDTVDVIDVLKPIYNFKAGEER